MPQTIVEKIAQAHLADGPNRPVRTGDFVSIRPFHVLTHDNTSAVISKFKAIGANRRSQRLDATGRRKAWGMAGPPCRWSQPPPAKLRALHRPWHRIARKRRGRYLGDEPQL